MAEKKKKMVYSNGLLSPHISKLTKTEKEILYSITEEFLSLKQIQQRRKCSKQAIYKHIRSLKNKGAFGLGNNGLLFRGTCQPNPNDVRLHGQEFNIKVLWQDQFYQKKLIKSNILFINGHTIKLYRNAIEIYSGEGISFYGKDEQEADRKSIIYWKRFFGILEHELKVIILKNRVRNIKEVNHHYARGNSEICEKNLEEERGKIRIYAEEDGKLAFITDESFGGKEDETLHPITGKRDRGAIDKQINDWRINDPPTNSELATISKETQDNLNVLMEMNRDLPKNIQLLAQQIESHLALIKEYRKENKLWRKKVEKKIRKDIKSEILFGKQTKINNFIK